MFVGMWVTVVIFNVRLSYGKPGVDVVVRLSGMASQKQSYFACTSRNPAKRQRRQWMMDGAMACAY